MTVNINLFSNLKISFNLKGNKPAISALSDASTAGETPQQEDLRSNNARKLSDTLSNTTLLQEDSGWSHPRHTQWIAGVGDISGPWDWANVTRYSAISGAIEGSSISSNAISRRLVRPLKSQYYPPSCDYTRSALQRHCDFWDTDGDNLIYPWDIFTGFRRLGFHFVLCLWAAITMALAASYNTQTSWIPHPLFAINLENINSNRHGSSTGTYDMYGNLDSGRFDAIFARYAQGKDYLTLWSTYEIWRKQCCALDFFGWFAGGLECKLPIRVYTHRGH
jgi:hypothetical protein